MQVISQVIGDPAQCLARGPGIRPAVHGAGGGLSVPGMPGPRDVKACLNALGDEFAGIVRPAGRPGLGIVGILLGGEAVASTHVLMPAAIIFRWLSN
jgi:hypothetical protein